jgi:hypothetical protein
VHRTHLIKTAFPPDYPRMLDTTQQKRFRHDRASARITHADQQNVRIDRIEQWAQEIKDCRTSEFTPNLSYIFHARMKDLCKQKAIAAFP